MLNTIICTVTENKPAFISHQLRFFAHCITPFAIALFILINMGCLSIEHLQKQLTSAYKNADFTFNAYKQAQPSPNIVLLGSSLMRQPFFLSDRNHSNYVPDNAHYCSSLTIQNILRARGLKKAVVFNLAIDGAIVSDEFLINSKLLRGSKKPEWIIYGLGPRDFIDSLISKETRTVIFDCLLTPSDLFSSKNPFKMTLNERLDLCMEKLCFLYDKRKQLQTIFANRLSSLTNAVFSKNSSKATKYNIANDETASTDWNDSIREYRKRYRTFNRMQFEKQKMFLKIFCQQSQNKGIKVLLVNMPLTKQNIDLLPPKVYADYHQAVIEVGQMPGVTLLDLHNTDKFPNAFFRDTAHLNAQGGHVISMLISDALTSKTKSAGIDGLASWWLAKAYFAQSKPPDIVILGSSQLGPLYGADAFVYNRLVDLAGDHRSYTIEHDLKLLLHKSWHVLLAGLPGTMISDQFAISRALFSNQYKPKLVAVIFSPSDFLDSTHCSVTTSEPFIFFSKYNNHLPLSRNLVNNMRSLKDCNFQPHNYQGSVSSLNLGIPFERICPGELVIGSGDGYFFNDDTELYRKKYKSPFSLQFQIQLRYLQELFAYLHQQHIPTIAIELPLTNSNHILLPETFWKFYKQRIATICHRNNVDLWDTESIWNDFSKIEFCDSAHLNLRGGLKLTRPVVLGIAYKLHCPIYTCNGNAGPLVPDRKDIYSKRPGISLRLQ